MSEFLPVVIVLVAVGAFFYFKQAKKKDVTNVTPEPVKPAPTKPAEPPAFVPDDQQLHPSWKALGFTYPSVLARGFDPKKPAPLFDYKPPETRHEADTSQNVFLPAQSSEQFVRTVQNGVPQVFQALSDGRPILFATFPTSKLSGFPTVNEPGCSVTLTVTDKNGYLVGSNAADLQSRVKVDGKGGPYTVVGVTKGYSGDIAFQAVYG